MTGHLPDVQWLVILLAIWAPDDEIFEPNYKFVRQRDIIELDFDDTDNFYS